MRFIPWLAARIKNANVVVNAVVFTQLFAAMFRSLPDAVIRWRDTLVGAGITAALFLIGQFGMGVYFGMKEDGTYGVASSFVLLLLWVDYSSMIFLLGAEFTQVWRGCGEWRSRRNRGRCALSGRR
jgi:membrane protein